MSISYILRVTKELRSYGSPAEEALKCAWRGHSWGAESQRMIWNLPDKQGKFGMLQAEGTACPKVCRYAGKFIFGELRIVWHNVVIILENGKRRAGKVHRSEITKGLLIQARKSGNYLRNTGEEPKDVTVGNAMARFTTWKYHSDCRTEVGL